MDTLILMFGPGVSHTDACEDSAVRRSTIFSGMAVVAYLAVVYLLVFIAAPVSLAVADFVASCGIAIPHPSGWNRAMFGNSGAPVLYVTLTGLVAILGYGLVIAGCAFYFGEHQDVRAQFDDDAGTVSAGRRQDAASPSAASRRDTNTQILEGDGSRGE